jgi:hypothetical protein
MTGQTKRVHRKACDCISKVNVKLACHGIEVSSAYNLRTHASVAIVATNKTKALGQSGRRGRFPTLYATHCPFCGRLYDVKTSDTSVRL